MATSTKDLLMNYKFFLNLAVFFFTFYLIYPIVDVTFRPVLGDFTFPFVLFFIFPLISMSL